MIDIDDVNASAQIRRAIETLVEAINSSHAVRSTALHASFRRVAYMAEVVFWVRHRGGPLLRYLLQQNEPVSVCQAGAPMSKRDHEEFETAFARFKENPSAGAIDAFTFEQWGRQYDADILRGWLYFQTHYPGATPVIDCKGLPCSWCRCLYCISQYRCIPE